MMTFSEMNSLVASWIKEASDLIKSNLFNENIQIDEKADSSDLVTEIDQEVEKLLRQHIETNFPRDKIIGEEYGGDFNNNVSSNVWFIDPIDGTLNFVKQKDNFAIIIARYVDGVGQFGAIYDVMNDELIIGNKGHGIYFNDRPYSPPEDMALNQSMININDESLINNHHGIRYLKELSLGFRVQGSAGIEFISLIKGNAALYINNLSPWDVAAAQVILAESDLILKQVNNEKLSLQHREYVIGGYPTAMEQFDAISKDEKYKK